MRKQLDRQVDHRTDLVVAEFQRRCGVAAVECVEKIQHAPAGKLFDHPVLRGRPVARLISRLSHCGLNRRRINRQNYEERLEFAIPAGQHKAKAAIYVQA